MYFIEAQAIVWTHQVGQWDRWVTENNELSFYIRETELLNKDFIRFNGWYGTIQPLVIWNFLFAVQ